MKALLLYASAGAGHKRAAVDPPQAEFRRPQPPPIGQERGQQRVAREQVLAVELSVVEHTLHPLELVHADIAPRVLPDLARALGERGVTLHTDRRAASLCVDAPTVPVDDADSGDEAAGPPARLRAPESWGGWALAPSCLARTAG
jgi:hypothetical protein